ncbi:hypothetical protein ACFQE1_08305 [Halobium palmae]|uniref:Glycosyltransferase RgtA/B/C/D-like domain-containing protein n=1 Tax=Halobium palmae TaxID=1776492 RepID=A0ABD5RY93_9EURY
MSTRVKKGYLALGFVALAAAAFVAHQSPATSHELSIYAGTPSMVWLGCIVAWVVATTCAFTTVGRLRSLALALGTGAVVLVASLPLIRNYRFLGTADSLTHLGWSKAIMSGQLEPNRLIYPGIHSISSELSLATGASLRWTLMFTVVLFTFSFLLGVPLLTRSLTQSRYGVVLGAISAWLLLPINNLASYMMPFPTSQAIFYAAIVMFAMLAYTRRGDGDDALPFGSPFGGLLTVLVAGVLLVHPQQTVNIVVILGSFAAVQFLVSRYKPDHIISHHRPVYSQFGIAALLFVLWVVPRPRFQAAVTGMSAGLLDGFFTGGLSEQAQTTGASLTEIGGSVPEIFAKLFLVSSIYIGLSALVVLAYLLRRRGDDEIGSVVTYFAASAIPLSVLFGLYYLATPTMAFRQLGFLMAVATLLGAVELSRLVSRFEHRFSPPGVRAVTATAVAAVLLLSVIIVFPSPFIYKSTGHVTDQQFSGYELTFDHRAEDVPIAGIRGGTRRWAHATYGVNTSSVERVPYDAGSINTTYFDSSRLGAGYDNDVYMTVTDADYQREVVLWHGIRYSERGFESLPRQTGVDHVATNQEFDLYYVNGTAPNATA